MENWTDEELLDQIITKANQIRIISESNDLLDMRRELLDRLENKNSKENKWKTLLGTAIMYLKTTPGCEIAVERFEEEYRKLEELK